MCNNDILKLNAVTEINVLEAHTWLAEDIDRAKLEEQLRTPKNTTRL